MVPAIVADTVIARWQAEQQHLSPGAHRPISPGDQTWFIEYTEHFTRYLYRHNKAMHRGLRSRNGREFLYAFVGHWWTAFASDPATFMARHKLEALVA